MTQQRRKLWVGIGTCVLLGGTGAAGAESAPQRPTTEASEALLLASAGGEGGGEGGEGGGGAMSVFSGGEGGEGGEGGGEGGEGGGEGGEGSSSSPAATESAGVYYSQLAFMLGHMRVARELYEAGDGDTGARHLGHPAGEHLPALEAALAARGLDTVTTGVRELAERAGDGGDWSAVADAHARAEQAIREAMHDVDEAKRGDAAFLARVLMAIAYKARNEYDAAVQDGRIVAAHEYHDAHGFLQVGRELLDRHAETFRAADPDAYAEMVDRFEALGAAWPSLQPPDEAAVAVTELYGLVSAFEFVANRY